MLGYTSEKEYSKKNTSKNEVQITIAFKINVKVKQILLMNSFKVWSLGLTQAFTICRAYNSSQSDSFGMVHYKLHIFKLRNIASPS